ncbi:MAG TPA: CHRD domain-containing protein [Candidatus Limnocylindria bacterium]|nr:CHRD domain-containing protein [Candidatus Limnocylindria bacterium]
MKRPLIAFSGLMLAATLAHGSIFDFVATLDGPSESPANASPGVGAATFQYDDVAHTLSIDVTFSGLTGNTTASHIHAATTIPGVSTAGVATQTPSFTGFPLGVTSGSYSHTFDLTLTSSFNSAYVSAHGGTAAGAEAALFTAMEDGKAYLNIHTTTFGGGEIRGFLQEVPAVVPEPTTTCVLGAGVLGAFALARRFRSGSRK